MEFIVTGRFTYTAKNFANGVVTESEEVGAISEIVFASSAEEAQELADRIFARYEHKYGSVSARSVVASVPAAPADEAADEAAPVARAVTPRLVCRKCGTVGTHGRYPFSTLPASDRLCDDCGA